MHPPPPGTRMSYHIRQRRPAGEAATATATAGRQKVIGTRTFSDTSGVSSVTPTPSATFRLVWSLNRYEPPTTHVARTILPDRQGGASGKRGAVSVDPGGQ